MLRHRLQLQIRCLMFLDRLYGLKDSGILLLLFMMIELCIYGLCAGLLRGTDIPTVFKVVIAQLAGRLVRAGAILFAVYALGSTAIGTGVILSSIAKGIPGLALQLVLIPLIVYRVENAASHEKSE